MLISHRAGGRIVRSCCVWYTSRIPLVRGFLIPRRGNTMKLKLATLLLSLTFCMSVFAFGNSQKPHSQAQQANAAAIAAAAASNKTVVDVTNKNANLNANKNTNLNANISDNSNSLSNRLSNDSESNSYSEGSYSNSKSGALSGSKSRAGDNTNNITIEGDNNKYPAGSAIAGLSTACTDALAGQVVKGGVSLGGESPDCKALRTAQAFFLLATTFKGTEEGKDYLKKGHYYANRAGVSGFELGIKRVRNVVVDIAILALPFILL